MSHSDDATPTGAPAGPLQGRPDSGSLPPHATLKKEKKKDKKKKHKKHARRLLNPCSVQHDRYHPSPILDDLEGYVDNGCGKLDRKFYEKELARLQVELVKMQYWIKHVGYRLILVFEGRDAAGKGGTIKRLTEPLNPRGCNVVALGTPSDQQKTQWYFQRYVEHFPSAGEIVVFDRSWYNRAGVEKVMGFCAEAQVKEFMLSCPEFERMLVRSGITLIKYWFSVSDEEQEARFRSRLEDPARRWKLSPMDLESRDRWVEFSKAKDEMFAHTNIPEAPWFTVEADDKRRARLNCIRHVLSKVPYEDMTPEAIELPPRKGGGDYQRPPLNEQFFVPNHYG
ncbi:polyphosphate kinase 2 [Synechococcus sp. CBW1004]|jgi:polyphosphate kinase 2|uniref:polyphosphate kinase 2 n=1 Tax=Synechococcus sp. CBW1004 TaxID=1353136 RepID=UPI0018CD6EF7|nr:polyphosphate kinase 2 [Synechococcus sp. CBW1004]